MKVLVEENSEEGLEGLLGKRVLLVSAGYFYEGKLVDVNSTCVKLEDSSIVYDTGDWESKTYSDIQKLNTDVWYVNTGLIESFGLSKND